MSLWLRIALAALLVSSSAASAAPLPVVAAENFYGDIARQIGGGHVAVTSILTNPAQDPHLFEASPSTARAFAHARLVLIAGAGYDPWAARLVVTAPSPGRLVIDVGALMNRKTGDNPHLWYDPATAPKAAEVIAGTLSRLDPANRADYAAGLAAFSAALRPLSAEVATLRRLYAGTPVAATEPVFDFMADAIGLKMLDHGFALAVMNDTEPSPKDVAAFQADLQDHRVRALLYNSQTVQGITERMRAVAKASGIPTVAIAETAPPGMAYQDWMQSQLQALGRALGGR